MESTFLIVINLELLFQEHIINWHSYSPTSTIRGMESSPGEVIKTDYFIWLGPRKPIFTTNSVVKLTLPMAGACFDNYRKIQLTVKNWTVWINLVKQTAQSLNRGF